MVNIMTRQSNRNFSFEFFPPKTPEGTEKLRATRQQLAALKPEFFSVTFGAGGTTQDGTLSTVIEIQREGFAAAPHLSCIGSSRDNIRANGISAGPIKTLAASGISGFGKLLKMASDNSPLKRNVTIEEVGNAAAFLCSDLASGISGEIMYVDGGFNTTAMPPFVE